MSKIAVINNNNFAPLLFQSMCEIISDCIGVSVLLFMSCVPSEKYLGPKQSPPISHNDLKNDGVQLLLSK